jgi:hypothetical protein
MGMLMSSFILPGRPPMKDGEVRAYVSDGGFAMVVTCNDGAINATPIEPTPESKETQKKNRP